jgi:hypothetical protein
MTPFEAGFRDVLCKAAMLTLPVLHYNQPEEGPKNWKESVEMAAKQVFGIEDPEPTSAYGVINSKPGMKQQLSYKADELQKKWNVHGKKPDSVGSKRRVTKPV